MGGTLWLSRDKPVPTFVVVQGLTATRILRLKPGRVPRKYRNGNHLDNCAVRQIRLSAQEAIEEDDTESLQKTSSRHLPKIRSRKSSAA